MYCKFFEFSEKPFNVAPDPRFLFLTDSYREALASMVYGVCERKGFISLIGEVGTGKTTLIRHVLDSLRSKKVETVFLYQTIITFDQMLKEILLELDIPLGDESKTSMIRQLNGYLIQRLALNENLALIIDEAQNLDRQVLEDLCLLSNLETNSSKLLQILLVGQPELGEKLNSPELRQLKQRISIGRKIRPLRAKESRQYIEHRLRLVGSNISKVFKSEALSLICEYTRGIPRNINMLCDHAFLIGYGLAHKKIDANIIREAIKDMDLSAPEKPVDQKVTLRRPSRVHQNSHRTWATYSRAAFLLLFILCLLLAFFVGRDYIKSTPAKLEAKTSATESVNAPFDKGGQGGISEAKPTSETSPEVKTEPIFAVNPNPAAESQTARKTTDSVQSTVHQGGNVDRIRSLEASQPLPVSTTPQTPPVMERPMGIGKNILPSEERHIKVWGKIPPSEQRPMEKREEELIEVKRGWNLSLVALHYYLFLNASLLDFILEANPEITDPDLIFPYPKIKIPRITEESLLIRLSDNIYNIHLGTFESAQEVNVYKDEPLLRGKKLEVVPRRVSPRETWYRIVVGEFNTKEEARRTIQGLKGKKPLPLLDRLPRKTPNFLKIVRIPDREIEKKREMGDTPEREK